MTYRAVYALGVVSLIAADVIILLVTLSKTYSAVRLACATHVSTPFSTVMLRDGRSSSHDYCRLSAYGDIHQVVFTSCKALRNVARSTATNLFETR